MTQRFRPEVTDAPPSIIVDAEYLTDVLIRLLETPSPSGYTDNAVRFVCERLGELGIEHHITRRGAIRANLPGERPAPSRAVVAHLDTLGAMVSGLKANGRLSVRPVGTWSSRFAEGARVTVVGDDASYRGSILPLKASGHAFGDAVDEQPTSWEHVEVRVDEPVATRSDVEALGINVGDYVIVDPQPEITSSGYVVSRHLDDKAGVACVLSAAKAIVDSGATPPVTSHLLFTIFEEVGSGASSVLHQDVAELVSVDSGPQDDHNGATERRPTVAMMDAAGPFDYHLTRWILNQAAAHDIRVRRAIFRYYRSDAATAVEAGNDIRTALLCFGTDASHGYERTHLEGLIRVAALLRLYMESPPVRERDRVPLGPIKGFTTQPSDFQQTEILQVDSPDRDGSGDAAG